MTTRPLALILPLLALPALSGCDRSSQPDEPPALSAQALRAVDENAGAPREKLARAIEALFTDAEAGQTQAVVILHRGRVVAERYGEGIDRETRLAGWSMAKSVTGTMIGLLVSDGRLRLDETPPVPAWQRSGDPRGEITLRQLLQMRSGLRHGEWTGRSGESDRTRMLFLDGRDNTAAYAEAQPLEAEPGRTFEYSSATTAILSDIAARSLTESTDPEIRRKLVADYLRNRLFEPLGMASMVSEFDSSGTLLGSSMIHGTARDWGKFGEFLRHGGSVRGAQLIPRGWIEFMTSPSPRNRAYGAQVWLNRADPDGEDQLFPGKAPATLFAAIGDQGQFLIVSPDQKLTLVRLGNGSPEQNAAVRGRLSDIVALFPTG